MLERVVVVNDVATARGGATGLTLLSIRLLRAAGVPVTFVVGDEGDNAELAALGVEVVALGGRHIARSNPAAALTRGLFNPAARDLLAGWIAASDTPGTAYHLHGWSKILSPAILSALAPVAARTVLHAHDFFLACPNGAFQDYRRDETCLRVPLGRDCLSTNCDKRSYPQKLWRAARQEAVSVLLGRSFQSVPVLMIHDGMGAFFERSGFRRERLAVLRNPVEPFRASRVEAERNEAFVFVGRVEREKGIEDAAEAARRAGVRLRVVGDGPERAEVEARYPEVEILGWSSRERIGELVADARALLMPSRYPEPFGLVAAEASRSGLPVVLSRKSFLAGEIEREGLGFACDTRDADAFAAVLRQIADMPAESVRRVSERAFNGTVPLATTLDAWRDALLALYAARIEASGAGAPAPSPPNAPPRANAGADDGAGRPRLRLFNVKYSPNLGDGLLSEALETALVEHGADAAGTTSVDLAARTAYEPGTSSRAAILKTLHMAPPTLRQAAIRVPLEIMLRRRWRPHYAAGLAGAQAVVVGGGNLFSDMDLNFPVKMAAALRLAAERGLPAAIYGVGVGEDWSEAGLRIMRGALRAAGPAYVSVRDAASKERFDRLFGEAAGREARIVRDPGLLVSRYVEAAPRAADAPVGLCVTSAVAVNYHSDLGVAGTALADWYVALAGRLGESGRGLVAFTNGSPEDERFLDGVEARLREAAGRLERRRAATPSELARLVSGFGLLVAHRMHALIAGFSYGVPVIALRWDRKVDAFMASVGAGDDMAVARIEELDRVVDAADRLLAGTPQVAAGSRAAVLADALADVGGLWAALAEAMERTSAAAARRPDQSPLRA